MNGPGRRPCRAWRALAALAVATLGATATAAEAIASAGQARIELDLRLPADAGAGTLRIRELSALAWHPERRELVAASDRGVLFRFAPPTSPSAVVQPSVLLELPVAPGQKRAANVEALTWRPASREAPGALWMSAEHGEGARRVGDDGAAGAPVRPWPAALAAALKDSRHGIEAMTWDARHGFVAGLQRPRAWVDGQPPCHALHAEDGRQWHFAPSGRGSSLKAIEALHGGTWLVLERVAAAGDGYRTLIRRLDPERCHAAPPQPGTPPALCDAPAVPLHPPLADGPDNFEGLACADDGRCWIVSDGGTARTPPTRLVQWRLEATR